MTPGELLARLRAAWSPRLVRTRAILQLEAAECGAVSLAVVLAYYGRHLPLEEIRHACSVSRDGSKASNILRAARRYGLDAKGLRKEPNELKELRPPFIVFWNFNHFLVVEGFSRRGVHLNDPASGRRIVDAAEFDQGFTGVVLIFEPAADFAASGSPPSVWRGLLHRLSTIRMALLFAVVASAALTVPGLLVPAFSRILVDDVLIQHLESWLLPLTLVMLATALVRGLIVLLQQHYLARLQTSIAVAGAARFFWHTLRLPVAFFAQRYGLEVAARATLSDSLAALLGGELATTAFGCLALVVYASVMVQYSVLLTLISLAFAVVNLTCLYIVSNAIGEASQRMQLDEAKLRLMTMQGFMLLDSLKATSSEGRFFGRWTGAHARVLNAEQELGRLQRILGALPIFLAATSSSVIIVSGGLQVMNGGMTIGMLIAFQIFATSFARPVQQLVGFGSQIQEVRGAIDRLDDVLRQELDPRFTGEAAAPVRLGGGLRARGLCYGYAPLEPPLIQNLDLSLAPGARLALVGGSGSGKSTLGKLIAGLYRPSAGQILIDGRPLTELTRSTLRGSIAFVDQNVALFPGTIRDNIALWDDTIPEHRIVAAAQQAIIHDEIVARPRGYESLVGEDGRDLSGGQRQRIVLARALVHEPSLMVLDEATSALDTITEHLFMDNLRRRGCSCIIIAHRLSTIRDCDEIVVLEHGSLIERGRHDELMELNGAYRRLVER